jgi:hypothetical protein
LIFILTFINIGIPSIMITTLNYIVYTFYCILVFELIFNIYVNALIRSTMYGNNWKQNNVHIRRTLFLYGLIKFQNGLLDRYLAHSKKPQNDTSVGIYFMTNTITLSGYDIYIILLLITY